MSPAYKKIKIISILKPIQKLDPTDQSLMDGDQVTQQVSLDSKNLHCRHGPDHSRLGSKPNILSVSNEQIFEIEELQKIIMTPTVLVSGHKVSLEPAKASNDVGIQAIYNDSIYSSP